MRSVYSKIWKEYHAGTAKGFNGFPSGRKRGIRSVFEGDKGRVLGAVMLSVMTVLCLSSVIEPAEAVTIDGNVIAYIEDEKVFDSGMEILEKEAEECLGYKYILAEQPVVSFSLASIYKVTDTGGFVENLVDYFSSDIQYRYVFTIGDHTLGAVTEEDREAAYDSIEKFISKTAGEYSWADEINVTETISDEYRLTEKEDFLTAGEFDLKINTPVEEASYLTVSEGETAEDIALISGKTVSELALMNPETDVCNLSAGERIMIKPAVYYLSVTARYTETMTEKIPYSCTYKWSRKVLEGETETASEGICGKTLVQRTVECVNGIAVSEEILDRTVISEPTSAVVLKGCKKDTGKMFYIPVDNCVVTSRFGGRYINGSYEVHTGVDFGAAAGTSVYAAAGGTVIVAGVIGNGNYGKLVVIDHGNGFKTYYAHNSKLLVSVGDVVEQCDKIALSGNTGRSTGPHVHFEVRYNNVAVNPFLYMAKSS